MNRQKKKRSAFRVAKMAIAAIDALKSYKCENTRLCTLLKKEGLHSNTSI